MLGNHSGLVGSPLRPVPLENAPICTFLRGCLLLEPMAAATRRLLSRAGRRSHLPAARRSAVAAEERCPWEQWHGYMAPVCRQTLQGELCPLSITVLPPKFAVWASALTLKPLSQGWGGWAFPCSLLLRDVALCIPAGIEGCCHPGAPCPCREISPCPSSVFLTAELCFFPFVKQNQIHGFCEAPAR